VALAQATQVLLAEFLYSLAAQLAPQVSAPVALKKPVAHSQVLVLSVLSAPVASAQLAESSHLHIPSAGEFSTNPVPVQQAVATTTAVSDPAAVDPIFLVMVKVCPPAKTENTPLLKVIT